jgi:hypothetical protein
MRIILDNIKMENFEISLEEIQVQLVGRNDEKLEVNDTTIHDMITYMNNQ